MGVVFFPSDSVFGGIFEHSGGSWQSSGLGFCTLSISMGWEGLFLPRAQHSHGVSARFHLGFGTQKPGETLPETSSHHSTRSRESCTPGDLAAKRTPGEMGALPEVSSLTSPPPKPPSQGNKPSPKSSSTRTHTRVVLLSPPSTPSLHPGPAVPRGEKPPLDTHVCHPTAFLSSLEEEPWPDHPGMTLGKAPTHSPG